MKVSQGRFTMRNKKVKSELQTRPRHLGRTESEPGKRLERERGKLKAN